MPHLKKVRLGTSPRPREFFRAVTDGAIRIRKLLQSERMRGRAEENSVAMDDAVPLATLIEELGRYGQKLSAAEAMDLAERLELLFDQLRAEVDTLLAS